VRKRGCKRKPVTGETVGAGPAGRTLAVVAVHGVDTRAPVPARLPQARLVRCNTVKTLDTNIIIQIILYIVVII